MKKLFIFLLCLTVALGLAACGSDKPGADDAAASTAKSTVGAAESTTTTATVSGATVPIGTKPTDSTVSTAPSTGSSDVTGSSAATSTTTTTVPTTTTTTVPGVTVPIGTQPPTSTTTTGSAPTAGTTGTTGSTGSTGSSATSSTTSSTTATTHPTQPEPELYIVLPAVGSDIDVTGQKNRIHVSAVAAWHNEDGTIGVSLTFKNKSSNWITEETNYVMYSCYDKDGNVIERDTKLPIGVIDTKKHAERTYTFDVPAETAEVRITKSKIVYWTEWA